MTSRRPLARTAFRWMMATETGDASWHTEDADIVEEMMYRSTDLTPFLAPQDSRDVVTDDFWNHVYQECKQWIPTLYHEDGSTVDPDLAARARMGKSGTVGVIITREPCRRCGGAGGWAGWHIDGGRCFRCGGRDSRTFEVVKTKVRTRAGQDRLEARRQKAEEAAEAKRRAFEAERAAFIQEHGLERLWTADVRPGGFLASLQTQLRQKGSLSEKQIQAAHDAFAREDERAQEASLSEHLGDVGQRITVPARVVFVKDLDGYYGPKRLVKLLVRGHHQAVTFSTSAWVWDVEQGDQVTITGTVKEHGSYQGAKQTVLTRTKLED